MGAERTLGLFVNRWGEIVAQQEAAPSRSLGAVTGGTNVRKSERQQLEDFCSQHLPQASGSPQWSHKLDNGLCLAAVEIQLFGVPHTFPGKSCETQEAAYTDATRRALWYLQCPGFEDIFEPDPAYVKAAAQVIPEPSSSWAKDGNAEGEEQQLAERKTAVMRVQNRLQQAYARQLEAGTSVWYWSYERDPRDKGWPPLFRATVHVPHASQTFSGSWLRGQREAQIDACGQIAKFLDEEFPRNRSVI